MRMPKSLTTAALALSAATLLTAPAHAAFISQWSFTVSSVFSSATPTGPGVGFTFTPAELSWGDPAGNTGPGGGRSALVITDSPAAGTITTDGAPELGNTFTHINRLVSLAFPRLDSTTVQTTVNLTPLVPAGAPLPTLTPEFTIDFAETPNAGPCPVGVPLCPDIFEFESGNLNFQFTLDEFTYFISVFEASNALNPLPVGACAAVGSGPGCIGFITEEQAETTAQFAFVITSAPVGVPEPGSFALLGAGLIAGGLALRRRR